MTGKSFLTTTISICVLEAMAWGGFGPKGAVAASCAIMLLMIAFQLVHALLNERTVVRLRDTQPVTPLPARLQNHDEKIMVEFHGQRILMNRADLQNIISEMPLPDYLKDKKS